jgi:hypothetical protein
MALYDLWKKQQFPKGFIAELYRVSVAIDGAEEALRNQRRDLGL